MTAPVDLLESGAPPANCSQPARQTAPFVVYAFFGSNGACLYVGQTANIAQRFQAHRRESHWFKHAASVALIADAETRTQARRIETAKIVELQPINNLMCSHILRWRLPVDPAVAS